jgi:hypothetical protein
MALILDYDEEVLRRHMQSRGLLPEVNQQAVLDDKSQKYIEGSGPADRGIQAKDVAQRQIL